MDVSIAMTIDNGVSAPGITSAVPIVAATAVVKIKGPMKLASAEKMLAFNGGECFRCNYRCN